MEFLDPPVVFERIGLIQYPGDCAGQLELCVPLVCAYLSVAEYKLGILCGAVGWRTVRQVYDGNTAFYQLQRKALEFNLKI